MAIPIVAAVMARHEIQVNMCRFKGEVVAIVEAVEPPLREAVFWPLWRMFLRAESMSHQLARLVLDDRATDQAAYDATKNVCDRMLMDSAADVVMVMELVRGLPCRAAVGLLLERLERRARCVALHIVDRMRP